jgi:hypothetical protein
MAEVERRRLELIFGTLGRSVSGVVRIDLGPIGNSMYDKWG